MSTAPQPARASADATPVLTRALHRGLLVLEAIATRGGDGGLGVTDIATDSGIDKATAARLAQTLCALGYAYQDKATRRYRLTGRLLWLGAAYRSSLDLPRHSGPHLAELRRRCDETVHLGVRELDRIVYIAKLETQRPVQIGSAVGQTMPLHTTALGKALLSAMPTGDREELIASLDLTPRTAQSITTVERLRREIEATTSRGYSIDDRENEETIICVGAPIVNVIGEVLGAISVSGPSFRIEDSIEELGELCRKTAANIGADL
jgi:IclR family KDG regulon transcriptional repressor